MKRQLIYAAALIAAACTIPSCSSDESFMGSMDEGVGAVMLSVATPQAEVAPGAEHGEVHIRIYNNDGALLRHYTGDTAPEQLKLLEGSYRADVTVGDEIGASFDKKFYKGSSDFTVTAGRQTAISVKCSRANVAAEVAFDTTIAESFDTASVWVAAASEADKAKLGKGELAELEYTESKTGYFLLPEGVESLIYKFAGQHKDTTYPNGGMIVKEGTVSGLTAGAGARMSFKFSPDAPGYIELFAIKVDKSTDDYMDDITWSDITITGSVDLTQVNDFIPGKSADLTYTVQTVSGIKNAYIYVGDKSYQIISGGSVVAQAGVTVDNSKKTEGVITLDGDFFAGIGGGEKMVRLRVVDQANGMLDSDGTFRVQGLMPVEEADYDLWTNGVTLKAYVIDPAATDVKLSFGGQTLAATKGENNIWSATFAAQWEQKTNGSNPSYYLPVSGVFANNSYTFSGSISGVDSYKGSFSAIGGDTIPSGSLEGNLSCYTEDNTSAAFWGSGNNYMKPNLCRPASYSGMDGAQCAKMAASYTAGFLAAGNLFTGTFSMSGTTGTVGFGQKYTYTARPKSIKFKYHATVGNVDVDKYGDGKLIPAGQPDQSSIYACIIDWSTRHYVTSGSAKPEGIWDPATVTEMSGCGKVIAYGQLYVSTTTSGSSLVEGEIPMRYYDTECAAPTGNYTIIIAASTSRYGDYMTGCRNNVLYVDDFRWGY